MFDQQVHLTQYLASKGIQTYRAHGDEVTVHCFFCDDGDTKGKGKLYVNVDSWLYDCKRCGERGNRKTLLRHFGDQDNVEHLPGTDPHIKRAVLSRATDLAAEMVTQNEDILEYLVGRGLSAKTIIDYRLGYIPQGWSLVGCLKGEDFKIPDLQHTGLMTTQGQDFLNGRITIPYFSHGDVIQLRGKDPHGKYMTPGSQEVRLFNADRLRDADDVIITEGEFDALMVQQALEVSSDAKLRSTAVVAIPGAEALPPGFVEYFSTAKRVYIALDPDDTGKKAAIRIKELLGSKARILELPDELPKCDWTEYLRVKDDEHPHGGHDWKDIRSLVQAANERGRRLWSIEDAEREWRRVDDEIGGIKLGFTELDAWISPGVKPGQLVIPIAKTGVGKTNFICNILYYTRLRPTLVVTLEQTRAEMYDRLRKIFHFWHPFAGDQEIREAFFNLRIVDQNRLREGDIVALCDEFSEEMGIRPQLALVDYLGYFAKGMKGRGAYEQTTNAVMTLKEEAKEAFVGLISPHQVNRMAEDGRPLEASDARDSGAVEETADIMCSLYRPAEAIAQQGDGEVPSDCVRIGLLKNRNGMKGMAATVRFSNASLVLVDDGTTQARDVTEENRMIWRGMTYEQIRSAQVARQQQPALSLVVPGA